MAHRTISSALRPRLTPVSCRSSGGGRFQLRSAAFTTLGDFPSSPLPMEPAMSALDTGTSPYLLAHKDNPLAWRVWSNDVLAEAEKEGKPILLSLGYSACHWCHVMNRESFSDPEIAKLINENFIPVIADRFQRPDLDQLYQAAANAMGHNGGWPLNLFLNAKGYPYFVAGYLPKEDLSLIHISE